jgi:hypothetical protein
MVVYTGGGIFFKNFHLRKEKIIYLLLYLLNKFFDMKKAIFFFSFMALLPMFIVAQKVKKVEFRLQMGGHLNDLSYAYSEAEPTKSGIHGNFMVRFSPFGGISCWSGLQYIQRGGRSDFLAEFKLLH